MWAARRLRLAPSPRRPCFRSQLFENEKPLEPKGSLNVAWAHCDAGGPYFWVGVCHPALKTLSLFQTKTDDFNTQFQTWSGTAISTILNKIYSDTVRDTVTPQTMWVLLFSCHAMAAVTPFCKHHTPDQTDGIYTLIQSRKVYTLLQARKC